MNGNKTFPAVVINERGDKYIWSIENRRLSDLPDGEVLIRVRYSSLNYKDALSATGNRGVTRNYPHTPGIDDAGEVAHSSSSAFAPGDEVLVTGNDLGQNTPGGWGAYIRVPATWVVPLPPGLTLRESMALGTAGFTAAQCVERIVDHGISPESGEIAVSGATGGVGSLAVAMLARLGYRVAAITGKRDRAGWLTELGAARVCGRDEALDASTRPLLSGKWAAAVDTVGGAVLSTLVRQMSYRGIVTAVGNAGGAALELTVFPFILRGVTLAGVDSAACPGAQRENIWRLMSGEWKLSSLDKIAREVTLEELEREIAAILAGGICGRVIVRHDS